MSVKILSSTLVGLDGFCQDPLAVLQQADNGVLAVLHNNAPAFYALTPQRLAQLLALEAAAQQPNDVTLDDSLFHTDAAPNAGGQICHVSGLATGSRFSAPGRHLGRGVE